MVQLKEVYRKLINLLKGLDPKFLIIFLSFLLVLVVFLILQKTGLTEYLIDILIRNFGEKTFGLVVSLFFIFLLCFLFLFLAYSIAKEELDFFKKKGVKWLLFTSLIILFIISLGLVFINEMFGAPNNEWSISGYVDAPPLVVITCGDDNGELIYFHEITCSFINYSYDVEMLKSDIDIFYLKGDYETIHIDKPFAKDFSFNVDEEISSIKFKISMETSFGETHYLNGEVYPLFETKEESSERKNSFLFYFLGLLFLCFVTIPKQVKEFIDISSPKEEHTTSLNNAKQSRPNKTTPYSKKQL